MWRQVRSEQKRDPIAVLSHPVVAVSLVGWILNDHVLKDCFPCLVGFRAGIKFREQARPPGVAERELVTSL